MKIMQASPSSNDKFLLGRKNWKMMTETLRSSFWEKALEDDEDEDTAGLSELK